GVDLAAADLLHLVTRSGALAMGLGEQVGDLSVGKQFDAVWLTPRPGGTLQATLRHAADATDALAKIFTLASPADIAAVWAGGQRIGPGTRHDAPADHPADAVKTGAVTGDAVETGAVKAEIASQTMGGPR
ncbi:MAG TPA: amidohydrolase family protein, partial [Beutenbergiaceae bacterium]|nr:amidohydrolase family protein [Beutenbergiaceae bacterium]